jgi:hypothetical protein
MRDHTEIEATMIAELKKRIGNHNWDWQSSTDKDTYIIGEVNNRNITNILHALTGLHYTDMEALKGEVIDTHPTISTSDVEGTPHPIHALFQTYIDWTHMGDSHYDTGMEGMPAPFGIVIPNA